MDPEAPGPEKPFHFLQPNRRPFMKERLKRTLRGLIWAPHIGPKVLLGSELLGIVTFFRPSNLPATSTHESQAKLFF